MNEEAKGGDVEAAKEMGLKGWEFEAYKECGTIVLLRRLMTYSRIGNGLKKGWKLEKTAGDKMLQDASEAVGKIVADQLFKGNFGALNTIGEGLVNLEAGRKFKPKAGRERSPLRDMVLMAFCGLQLSGVECPSQKEVAEYIVSTFGASVSKSKISKLFEEFGLKTEASDARKAMSQAGKRKRDIT